MPNLIFQAGATQTIKNTVVLLHGFCETAEVWENMLQFCSLDEWNYITITLPGHSTSEEAVNLPTSLHDYATGVVEQIRDLGVRSFVCIGHSLGGYIGLQIAKYYPEILLGLCLFQSMPFADTEETKKNRNRQIELLREGKKQGVIDTLVGRVFSDKTTITNPEIVQTMREKMMLTPTSGMIAALEAMRDREDTSDALLELEIPVLHYLGALDPIVLPQKIATLYASKPTAPKNLQMIIDPDIAHMAMLEKPRRSAQVLQFFLESVLICS